MVPMTIHDDSDGASDVPFTSCTKPPLDHASRRRRRLASLALCATLVPAFLAWRLSFVGPLDLLGWHPVVMMLALCVPLRSGVYAVPGSWSHGAYMSIAFALVNVGAAIAYAARLDLTSLHACFGVLAIIAFKAHLCSGALSALGFHPRGTKLYAPTAVITVLTLLITAVLGLARLQQHPGTRTNAPSITLAVLAITLGIALVLPLYDLAALHFHSSLAHLPPSPPPHDDRGDDALHKFSSSAIDEIVDVHADTREISSGSSGHNSDH